MKKTFANFCRALFFIPCLTAHASVPNWYIVPCQSNLTFTAIQNDSPTSGTFHFTGDIHFDPTQLNQSSVRIVVDMLSIDTPSYKEIADTLKTTSWFDTKKFPQAIFTANKFTLLNQNGQKRYQADGTLRLRDKTLPFVLTFTLDQYSNTHAEGSGEGVIKRSQFGVGQGEWASTRTVKDDVKIHFHLVGIRDPALINCR